MESGKKAGNLILLLWLLMFYACKPESPVTSFITIDLEKTATPVNKDLYGITLEEINHAIEGGLYAELIQNRSFEYGLLPLGCQYDTTTNCLQNPAGWSIPFVRPNVIPGWHALSEETFLVVSSGYPINEHNPHFLYVQTSYSGRGGAVAEGFSGISLRKGEKYHLSFFFKSNHYGEVSVELRDSMAHKPLSESFLITPIWEWVRMEHTFTATEDMPNATLVFSAEEGTAFSLDQVSLFPEKTWKMERNGLRPDLMEALIELDPKFVRFPGGAYVESYTSSMIPRWRETVGAIETRKPLWSIWGYGTSNGFGFHEYLQLCENLHANPVYVTNAGMLNQRYRLRYDEMKNMNAWIDNLTSAMAYATHPVDSLYGQLRAENGHLAPFPLSFVEIGSQNRGFIYERRYRSFRSAVKDSFPHIAMICNDTLRLFDDWSDVHYKVDVDYLLSSYNAFDVENLTIRTPMSFVGEFGAACSSHGGTLRAAVGEAAFLLGAERNPINVKGVAYSPLLGHAKYSSYGVPAIQFDASRIVKHPSYYVLKMFAQNQGDELLYTSVDTYKKALVTFGRASVMLYDFNYEVNDIMLNEKPFQNTFMRDTRTYITPLSQIKRTLFKNIVGLNQSYRAPYTDRTKPEMASQGDELKRYMMVGDSMAYNYSFSAKIKCTSNNGKMELRVRDNGLPEELSNYIALAIEKNKIGFYHCAGSIERLLAGTTFSFDTNRWYTVNIKCEDDRISCFVDNQLLIDTTVFSIPSLISVATREIDSETIILKVVNTTYHEEWASVNINEGRIENEAEVIQLAGRPDVRNTLDNPDVIVPDTKVVKFSFRRPFKYLFPPNSVTVIRMKLK
ncbi:MAG: glycoside hydrolase [Tannerella sp.]|nr:glycoside hydrolase [Tannerella sp.]